MHPVLMLFFRDPGAAAPARLKAWLKAFQVKLLRLPPRRLSHLNAHSVAHR